MHDERGRVTRRRFLALGAGAGSAALACASGFTSQRTSARARLRSRPKKGAAPTDPMTAGEHPLALGSPRDGLVYVPRELPTEGGAPLVVMLHGAGGSAKGITKRATAYQLAEEFKAVVLVPESRDGTWDVIRGAFGPDVAFLDQALELTFKRVAIDPRHVAIGGFSDGASYALSLGLINGDIFTHIIAFSPGFLVADEMVGHPSIFVSHGKQDEILPIDATSRRLVPSLQEHGYAVRYREFEGPHTVPQDIAHEAFEWMNGQPR
jgi:phospholipase/carboxylesterase